MKDWRRSPEPPSMMGIATGSTDSPDGYGTAERDLDPVVDAATILPRLIKSYRSVGSGKDAKLSLTNMCKKVIMRNIHAVQNLGDMPFRIAKDILEQCKVDQLVTLEAASPHLLEHTEPIWKRNSLRDFVDLRKKYEEAERREPKSWRKAYFRKKGELEEQKEEAKQRIKDRYASHRAEKDAKKLVVSDKPLMKVRGSRRSAPFPTTSSSGSKGQSLMMKARSGSVASARLTARGSGSSGSSGSSAASPSFGGTRPIPTVGKARAVAHRLQPPIAQRPMVPPKRISGQSVRLREAAEWNQKGGTSEVDEAPVDARERAAKDSSRQPLRSAGREGPAPSLRHQPSSIGRLPPSTPAPPSPHRQLDRHSAASNGSGNRRSIDFFGNGRGSSSPSVAAPQKGPGRGTKRPSSSITVVKSKMARTAPLDG